MTIREEILQELREIAPNLAALEKKDPFLAPDGYFNANQEVMHEVLSDKEVRLPSSLQFAKGVNPFRVPEDYFANSKEALMQSVSNEADALPSFLQKAKVESFKVPEDYFASNQAALLAAISGEQEVLPDFLVAARKSEAFKVPPAYFEELPQRVLQRIAGENGAELQDLKKEEAFQVPAAYFEELPDRVMQRIREENGAKVVPMEKPSTILRIRPYVAAVAAMFIMAITATFVIPLLSGPDKPPIVANDWEMQLASLSDEEVSSALTESIDDLDEYYMLDNVGEYDIFTFSKLGDEFLNDYLLDEIDEELLRELI